MGILPSLVGVIVFMAIIPFWSNFAKKRGFKKTYWVCFLGHGITFIPFLFITDIYIHTICVGVMYGFYSGEIIMLMPVAADTYDLVSSKMEKRVDATLVGVRTFFFRIAFIATGIILPVVHILTLYRATDQLAAQTPLAVWGIRFHAALIPAIIYIIMALIFRQFYTLEGAEKEALVRKLKELEIYR